MSNIVEIIKRIFSAHQIAFEIEEAEEHRYLFHWNKVMYDAGLSAENVMLDFTIDPKEKDLYLGLIRVPPAYRGRGIGMELVEALKHYADENGYSVLLESADENIDFWKKEQFSSLLHEDYGFWVMGYGGEGKRQWLDNWHHLKEELYPASTLPKK